jgi:hypothetical protein
MNTCQLRVRIHVTQEYLLIPIQQNRPFPPLCAEQISLRESEADRECTSWFMEISMNQRGNGIIQWI